MGGGVYGGAVKVVSSLMILLGLAILVRTLGLGGGPLSFGFLVGLILTAIGAARLWLALKMGRDTRGGPGR